MNGEIFGDESSISSEKVLASFQHIAKRRPLEQLEEQAHILGDEQPLPTAAQLAANLPDISSAKVLKGFAGLAAGHQQRLKRSPS